MALTKKLDNPVLETLRKLNVDEAKLRNLKPTVLTDREITKSLGARATAVITSVTLSPNKPKVAKRFLSFYASMMVLANPAASNNIALFSSAFPSAVNPGLQVEFDAIKPGKKHLVEFNLTFNDPSKQYKFRVFHYPLANFQDVTISGSQVISVLIPASAGITDYGAAISQLNTKAEACGWIFHSLKISAVD